MIDKKYAFSAISALVLLCLVAACSNSKSTAAPPYTLVQSSVSRDTNPQASDADLAAVVAGNTDFALKAFPLIDPSGTSNVVFSPYSVTEAFALAAPGAGGTTLSGIEQAMSFLPQAQLNPALNRLDLLVTSEATGTTDQWGTQYPILKTANAVWGQEGFTILPDYLDTLAVNYGAGLRLVDFINATESARQAINAWVADRTNNRILDVIPEGGVDTLTRVVLTNAVWFKANWESQFSEATTTDQSFFNRDGSTISVPFMHQIITASYAAVDNSQAIDIPYVGDKFSLLVVMPDTGAFDSFLSALTPTVLSEITGSLNGQEVDLALPKFSITKASNMGDLLKSLGMTDAFEPGVADLSGIDGMHDLSVQNVFHKAFISVDEHGTEAAAATAIGVGATGMPVATASMTVDHPFLFFIRERQTGLILFMGKVVSLS